MPEPVRARPDAAGDRAPAVLAPGPAGELAEFARACRAAARAVALYPGNHPAVATPIDRLATLTTTLTELAPFRVQALADRLLIDGVGLARPDAAVAETAALFHRHLIGALTVGQGADAAAWHALLLILARAPEDVRADGGIGRLWASAGEPGIEIQVVDYAEVLREKQGRAQTIEAILAAAMAHPGFELDEVATALVGDAISEPGRLDALLRHIERAPGSGGADGSADTFVNLLRGMVRVGGSSLADLLEQFRDAAQRLSAATMLSVLERRHRPDAVVGDVNVIGLVLDGMADDQLAGFVAGSVIAEQGATERLAHAFSALVPDRGRQLQLLALARAQVAWSAPDDDPARPMLVESVQSMLGSYSDARFVSTDYANELSNARSKPIGIEGTADDPPARIEGWLSSIAAVPLRALDCALLVDLLAIEADLLRWQDIADMAAAHADDLLRAGAFDQACSLVEAVIAQGAVAAERRTHAAMAVGRCGRGVTLTEAALHLQEATDEEYGRFAQLCQALGTRVIALLADALSQEPNPRAQQRLRQTVLGFGQRGRQSVRQLLNTSKWEVRRTAVLLLTEMGGADSLKELIPLLLDPEPLVKREAVQAVMRHGGPQAAEILLAALTSSTASGREALGTDILSVHDERAGVLLCDLVRRLDRRALPRFHLAAIEALGTLHPDGAVAVLDGALLQRDRWAPFQNRRVRTAAARSLRTIGTASALDALRQAAAAGPFGTRAAARAALAGHA